MAVKGGVTSPLHVSSIPLSGFYKECFLGPPSETNSVIFKTRSAMTYTSFQIATDSIVPTDSWLHNGTAVAFTLNFEGSRVSQDLQQL